MFGQGRRAWGKFRKQQALLRHGAEKRFPGTGIYLVNARSQNADTAPHAGQGSLVGHAVDTLRHAGNNGDAAGRETACPWEVARREPTMAKAGACSREISPRQYSSTGASGSSRNRRG